MFLSCRGYRSCDAVSCVSKGHSTIFERGQTHFTLVFADNYKRFERSCLKSLSHEINILNFSPKFVVSLSQTPRRSCREAETHLHLVRNALSVQVLPPRQIKMCLIHFFLSPMSSSHRRKCFNHKSAAIILKITWI